MELARFLHIAAMVLLFGASLFPWYAGREQPLAARTLRLLFIAAAGLGLITALAWFALVTAQMTGAERDLLPGSAWTVVLTQTTFGSLWAFRIAILLSALALGFWMPPVRRLWPLLLAAAALASLAGTGHAASLLLLLRAVDAVHALAAGAWVGGLVPLVLVLIRRETDPAPVLERFSAMGMIAVAVLVASGLVNAWLHVDSPWHLAGTTYGALLLAKLVLLALMLACAAANRFLLMPRLRSSRTATGGALLLSVGAELVLGAAVLALAAMLGMTEPPH